MRGVMSPAAGRWRRAWLVQETFFKQQATLSKNGEMPQLRSWVKACIASCFLHLHGLLASCLIRLGMQRRVCRSQVCSCGFAHVQKLCSIYERLISHDQQLLKVVWAAGTMRSFLRAIEAAQAAQLLPPSECNAQARREALQAVLSQLAECSASPGEPRSIDIAQASMVQAAVPGVHASAPECAPSCSAYSSSMQAFLQASETAWRLGLHDNMTAALQTLQDWVGNAQKATHVMVIDSSRHPDSLPWDCGLDAADPHTWQQPHQATERHGPQLISGLDASTAHEHAVLDLLSDAATVDDTVAPPVRSDRLITINELKASKPTC